MCAISVQLNLADLSASCLEQGNAYTEIALQSVYTSFAVKYAVLAVIIANVLLTTDGKQQSVCKVLRNFPARNIWRQFPARNA
jgi:hypothetical protein